MSKEIKVWTVEEIYWQKESGTGYQDDLNYDNKPFIEIDDFKKVLSTFEKYVVTSCFNNEDAIKYIKTLKKQMRQQLKPDDKEGE